MAKKNFGAIEAGGTRMVCRIIDDAGQSLASTIIATNSPDKTLLEVIEFFSGFELHLSAIGIASFGPLDLDPSSPNYGAIRRTPKPGWKGVNLKQELEKRLSVPVAIDTDVNGAASGEYHLGVARGCKTFIYFTIGTGIGASLFQDGKPVNGMAHPEMGHMLIPHDCDTDDFGGCCPFHGDCLEGLASGRAMEMRWGVRPEALPQGHPAWLLEADYLAAAVHNVVMMASPEKVILGGGIMRHPGLLALVKEKLLASLSGYPTDWTANQLDRMLVSPRLGDDAGVTGAFLLAKRLYDQRF